jgi:DNA polymerase-2
MNKHTGWLLDVYPDLVEGGAAVWFLDDDGQRLRLRQPFPISFYAAGPAQRLRALWRFLSTQPIRVELCREEGRDVFCPTPLTVLKIRVARAYEQPGLFHQVVQAFPDLDYYDADIHLLTRYAAACDVFPLTRSEVAIDDDHRIQAISPLESRWNLDPESPPLRILRLAPDTEPFHARPAHLLVRYARHHCRLPLEPVRPCLAALASILRRFDPDLILSAWGDTWLLPHLLGVSKNRHDLLPLNRDACTGAIRRAERTYIAYGQIIHRGEQILLAGRFHIDGMSAMMYDEYGLEGVYELARVTGLPVQVVARNSPGAGITAMEIITALRERILVPYRKQQSEIEKSANDLIRLDQGGLVYQPLVGLHQDVGEVDFISMYPSIMRRFNISPENMDLTRLHAAAIEGLDRSLCPEKPGILPVTLAPILDKRMAIKERLSKLRALDCRYLPWKARATALKWLLVVSFGYTGYKNAKFGRIEAHQAITAYAREALLTAKETAEALGFTVLHMYVDGLWVKKPGASSVPDFQPLLDVIAQNTGLSVALDGIFNWMAFLPSRTDARVPVANRYFGVFQNGEIKARGIEARRRDTPPFIAEVQMELLQLLARAATVDQLSALLPEIDSLLRRRLRELRNDRVGLARLVVSHKLSRHPEDFRVASPAALAAGQLKKAGKATGLGHTVRFLYTKGETVVAWDALHPTAPVALDKHRYTTLLLRAAATILSPLGVNEEDLRCRLLHRTGAPLLPGFAPSRSASQPRDPDPIDSGIPYPVDWMNTMTGENLDA